MLDQLFASLPELPSFGGNLLYALYGAALVGLWMLLGLGRWAREKAAKAVHFRAASGGASEPDTLHPVIDPARCVGCGACTHACPEGKIIGMIGGKAALLDPGACIGHGACKTACPVGAIDLVLGSARRGVEIPVVSPSFESNVPGLYIAGELGGMGLIANAVEQGRQAMEAIAKRPRPADKDLYDVIVIGAGPAGIAATLAARQHKLTALTFEQDSLGGTVARYPRGKIVMTRPARLPIYGKVKLRRVRKERLLGLWHSVMAKTGIAIHDGIRVTSIVPHHWGFEVQTAAGPYRAHSVLLATGRRGSPRRLGVPGESQPKVVYSLDDPAQYRGRHVMVVGGGDSALEAATTLARYPLASLTLCHRGNGFPRARQAGRQKLEAAQQQKRLTVLADAHVRAIATDHVVVDLPERAVSIANDVVIICAGGMLPASLLADIGVAVETRYGT